MHVGADPSLLAGPSVRVVESGSSPPSSTYRDVASSTSSAAVPLVLLARVGPLSSADTLRATSAERRGAKIAVALEVRHDTGALLGNDATLAFVEVALGTLPDGSYDAMVRRTTSTFSEPGHPELARDPVETATTSPSPCADDRGSPCDVR